MKITNKNLSQILPIVLSNGKTFYLSPMQSNIIEDNITIINFLSIKDCLKIDTTIAITKSKDEPTKGLFGSKKGKNK